MKNELVVTLRLIVVVSLCYVALSSCARKENECKSRESMTLECQVVHTPQYGRQYAHEECNRKYSADKCY